MSFVVGLALCAAGLALLALGGGAALLWNPPALALTLLGTAGLALLMTPLPVLRTHLRAGRRALRARQKAGATAEELLDLVQTARRNGVLALEGRSDETGDGMLKAGLELVSGSADRETTLSVLRGKADEEGGGERAAEEACERLAAFVPGVGVLGSLVQVVQMLYTYKGPQTLAPGLARALLPVAYSAAVAYLVLMPLASRMRAGSEKLRRHRELVIQGVLAIQAGEPSFIAQQRLSIYEEKAAGGKSPHD